MMEQSEQAHTGMADSDDDNCSPHSPLRLTPVEVVGSQSRQAPQPRRKTVELAPSRAFNPSKEEVLRWAITVAHTHRRFHRDYLVIRLASVGGKMAFLLGANPSVLDRLTPRLPSGLTVREPPTVPPLALLASANARVTLPAGLRDVPDSPDILGDFARVFAGITEDEYAELVITLASADKPSAKEPFRLPKVDVEKVLRDLHHHAMTDPLARPVALTKPASIPAVAKVVSPPMDPGLFFRVALASHAFALTPSRARELALAVAHPFHAWAPSGTVRVSSRASSPEALTTTRYPRGRGSRVVPESVIAGLLLPPTASCTATNVRRTAASAPVSPGLVPLRAGVWPIGTPLGYTEPMGIPSRDVLFSAHTGKPGYGKTKQAETEFRARTGLWPGSDFVPDGGAFYDPHRKGARDLLGYYWETPERVLRLDLGGTWEGMRVPVYNPLDCRGVSDQEAERRVAGIVGGLSVAAGWDMKATRALPIANQAVMLLVAMARGLGPRDPVPTPFQIPTVLMDEGWRRELLDDPRIPPSVVRWWRNEGASYKPADFGPITQIVSRIRSSVPLTAFLGGHSTFTPRQAMDDRMVMLIGGLLSGDDQKDKVAVAMLLRILIQAAYSRGDLPDDHLEALAPFWLFVDELPVCDGADFRKVFMELRKFLIRCKVMAVTPAPPNLSAATWEAAITAASVVMSTAIDSRGAALVANVLRGIDAADLSEIEQFHHLVSVPIGGKRSEAFSVKGMQPSDLFISHPEIVEAHIATDPRYRDVAEVVAELDTLDDRLMRAWRGEKARGGTVSVDS